MTYTFERALSFPEIVTDLSFSHDGAMLAVATRDKKTPNHIYDLGDGSERPAPRFVRRELRFVSDTDVLVAGSSVERYTVARAKLGKKHFSIAGHSRGLTHTRLSPDGRWVVVSKYLETMELWFLGGAAPKLCESFLAVTAAQPFFSADSTGFFYTTGLSVAGAYVMVLHGTKLSAEGAHERLPDAPMPEGLSVHDAVFTTRDGLVATTFPAQDVVVYDWTTWKARPLGVGALLGHGFRCDVVASPSGEHLLARVNLATEPDRRDWRLQVIALPGGEALDGMPLDVGVTNRLALSPDATRIAYVGSDKNCDVQIFKRA
jgi:dipeptidyl aminopeptidase/acylaminoacyl peptidase